MNLNQNGKGTFSSSEFPDQRKYRGMVKVLPTLHPPSSSFQKSFNGSTSPQRTAAPDSEPGFQTHFFAESGFQPRPVSSISTTGNETLSTVPRLPPPPRHVRTNSQIVGAVPRNRSSLHASVHDLRSFETGNANVVPHRQELVKAPSSGTYDRRSLNFSVKDLRKIDNEPFNSQQRNTRPLSLTPLNGIVTIPPANVSNVQPSPASKFQIPSPRNPAVPAVTPPPIPPRNLPTDHHLSHLHDQVAQLSRELAAMKDPMREHEDWLKIRSAEMKELEEIQRQLQTNMPAERQKPKTASHPTSPKGQSIQPQTSPPPLPTSPKPTATSTPVQKTITKPSLTLPSKPNIGSKIRLPKPVPPDKPGRPEITVTKTEHDDHSNIDKVKSANDTVTRRQTVSTNTTSIRPESSTFSVKRMSKFFEDNAEKVESNVKHAEKTKSGTIRKLSPALLKQIETAEENRIATPNRKIGFNKSFSMKYDEFSKEQQASSPVGIGEQHSPPVPEALTNHDTGLDQLKPSSEPTTPQASRKPLSINTYEQPFLNSSNQSKVKLPEIPPASSKPKVVPHNLSFHVPREANIHKNLPPISPKPNVLKFNPIASRKPDSSISTPDLSLGTSNQTSGDTAKVVANSRFYVLLSPSDSTTPSVSSVFPNSSHIPTLNLKPNSADLPSSSTRPKSEYMLSSTSPKPTDISRSPPFFIKPENPTLPLATASQETTITPVMQPPSAISYRSSTLKSATPRPQSCVEPLTSSNTIASSPPSSTMPSNVSNLFPASPKPLPNISRSTSNISLDKTKHALVVAPTKVPTINTHHRYENVPLDDDTQDPTVMSEFIPENGYVVPRYQNHADFIPDEIRTHYHHAPNSYSPPVSPQNRTEVPKLHLTTGMPEHIQVNQEPQKPEVSQEIAVMHDPSGSDAAISSSNLPYLQAPSLVRPTVPPPPPPTIQSQQTILSMSLVNNETLSATPPGSPSLQPVSEVTPPPLQQRLEQNNIPELDGSKKSSISSQSELSLSSQDSATKGDLMEQIRQFKESGKILRKTATETGECNGTPTRVRKNEIENALQTRFQAFCGNESDSSSNDDDLNMEDEDWDDF